MVTAFVLLSGGIDSAVCLAEATTAHEFVEAIHFDYGQQTRTIEHESAQRQAEAAGVSLHTCDYRAVFDEFAEGTIEDQAYDAEETTVDGHSVGYVPQRNLHFLTSAAAIAEHHTETGEDIVLYHGAQAGDAADYPDCRPAFIDAATDAIDRGTEQHSVRIETPLIELSKAEVIRRGDELGVDWTGTFSCYNAEAGEPCGECPACLERQEAFAQVDITDPISE